MLLLMGKYAVRNCSADAEMMHVAFSLKVTKRCDSVLIISPERCHLAVGEICSSVH